MNDRKKTILVVDGSETFLRYTAKLLYRMGYEGVLSARNGTEALIILNKQRSDAVLLDIMMPGTDGMKTFRHIKSDELLSDIPVIITAFGSDRQTYEDCKRLGCAGYLVKPINIPELYETLNHCITYSDGKKRNFLRSALEDKVVIKNQGIPENLSVVCLSEGGMYVRKKNPYPVGTEVDVNFTLRDGKTMDIKGTVIYLKGLGEITHNVVPGMAIKFHDLAGSHSAMLRTYIEELLIEEIIEGQIDSIKEFYH